MARFRHGLNFNAQAVDQLDQAAEHNEKAPVTTFPTHGRRASATDPLRAHPTVHNGSKNANGKSPSHSRANSSGGLMTDVCSHTQNKSFLAKAEHVLSKRFFGRNTRRKTIDSGKSQGAETSDESPFVSGSPFPDHNVRPEKVANRRREVACSSNDSNPLNPALDHGTQAKPAQVTDRHVDSTKHESSETELSAPLCQIADPAFPTNQEHDSSDMFFGVEFRENIGNNEQYLSGPARDFQSEAILSNYEFAPPEESVDATYNAPIHRRSNQEYGSIHLLPLTFSGFNGQNKDRFHHQRLRSRATTKARSTEDLATLLQQSSSRQTALPNFPPDRNLDTDCSLNDTSVEGPVALGLTSTSTDHRRFPRPFAAYHSAKNSRIFRARQSQHRRRQTVCLSTSALSELNLNLENNGRPISSKQFREDVCRDFINFQLGYKDRLPTLYRYTQGVDEVRRRLILRFGDVNYSSAMGIFNSIMRNGHASGLGDEDDIWQSWRFSFSHSRVRYIGRHILRSEIIQ